jgi:hypothetical protein
MPAVILEIFLGVRCGVPSLGPGYFAPPSMLCGRSAGHGVTASSGVSRRNYPCPSPAFSPAATSFSHLCVSEHRAKCLLSGWVFCGWFGVKNEVKNLKPFAFLAFPLFHVTKMGKNYQVLVTNW